MSNQGGDMYEQTDFASEVETLREWRARMFPAPTRRARLAVILPGVGLGVSFALFLLALRLLVVL
jgi:hypothetical protein